LAYDASSEKIYVDGSPGTMCPYCFVFSGTEATIFDSGIEKEIGYTGIAFLLVK
jgi:hypothetical protein